MRGGFLVAAVTGMLTLAGTLATAVLSQRAHCDTQVREDAAGLRKQVTSEREGADRYRTRYWRAIHDIRYLLGRAAREHPLLQEGQGRLVVLARLSADPPDPARAAHWRTPRDTQAARLLR